MVEVVAGGDVIVNRSEPETIFEQCRDTLRGADITFANSETTYSTRGTKVANIVGMMRADPRNLSALSYAGFDVMSFANNHHLDAGPEAFFDTLDGLHSRGILTCGAGADNENRTSAMRGQPVPARRRARPYGALVICY